MTEQKIYEKFIKWLDNPMMELTESEVMMPMMAIHLERRRNRPDLFFHL